jgi:hypothetical protein
MFQVVAKIAFFDKFETISYPVALNFRFTPVCPKAFFGVVIRIYFWLISFKNNSSFTTTAVNARNLGLFFKISSVAR